MDVKSADKLLEEALHLLSERTMWSAKVQTKWHPPEGFFDQSAEKIASGMKAASSGLKQSMSRLNFYINRGGKNLSDEDMKRLEAAKKKLQSAYRGGASWV